MTINSGILLTMFSVLFVPLIVTVFWLGSNDNRLQYISKQVNHLVERQEDFLNVKKDVENLKEDVNELQEFRMECLTKASGLQSNTEEESNGRYFR